jgi:hypothetical protein
MDAQPDCLQLISEYLQHLTSGFEIIGEDKYCRIITPFWRPDGDHIEFFITSLTDELVRVSDEGQTTDWLFSVGVEPEGSDKRERIFENLISTYQLVEKDGVISTDIRPSELPEALHRFLAGVHSITHLSLTRAPRGTSTFRDDVEMYLLEHQQKYEVNYSVQGKAVRHSIDFYVNSTRNWLVEALTATSASRARDLAQQTAFKWLDIRAQGWDRYEMIVVLDDSENKEDYWKRSRVRRPLEEYSNLILSWTTERTRLLGPLVSPEET